MAHWHKIAELSTEPYQNCGYFGALRLFEPYEFISMYTYIYIWYTDVYSMYAYVYNMCMHVHASYTASTPSDDLHML